MSLQKNMLNQKNEKEISDIEKELKKWIDKKYKEQNQKFFKEKILCYGVRASKTRKISAKYFSLLKEKSKEDIFKLAEKMLQSGYNEEAVIAFDWVYRLRENYTRKDWIIFQKWIRLYVDNWAKCDNFCGHILGYFLEKYPQFVKENKKWAKNKNRWMRRASAVSLISLVKQNKKFLEAFEICDILLKDSDKLTQKGYGWLLKEMSNINQEKVFLFLQKRKKQMPRTALRYAIEKFPKEKKIVIMQK